MIERFNIAGFDYKTPIEPRYYFDPINKDLNMKEKELKGKIKWMRSIIGGLLFIAGATRPDIQYAVNYLARFVMLPHDEIMKQTKRILQYLMSTADLCIVYRRTENEYPMIGYTDSDHSGDKSDFVSMKGSLFMYGDGPVCWKSKKGRVAQSSTDAELDSFIKTANISVKLRRILCLLYGYEMDAKYDQATYLFCDNNSMLKIVTFGTVTNRTGYLTQDACVANQYVKEKTVRAMRVDTEFNLADIMTKPVSGVVLASLRRYVLRENIEVNRINDD